jgi:hypothetical protein
MLASNPPETFWHCKIRKTGQTDDAIVNDLTYQELLKRIIIPWRSGTPFTVAGMIVRSIREVSEIKIVHTTQPRGVYENQEIAEMRNSSFVFPVDGRYSPLSKGEDLTFELLFAGLAEQPTEVEDSLVERLCARLPKAAQILSNRTRKDKGPYVIKDEYDVQDLLHAMLRAYLKYSVQEDPLGKVAGAKSGRADISIEELGTLIEVKYVHGPDDQKRLFEEFSQDLVLYTQWARLKHLIYLIYNSSDLRDAEQFEKLSHEYEVNGKRFRVKVILA